MPTLSPPDTTRARPASGLGVGSLVLGASIVASAFLQPTIVQNVTVGDLVIAALVGILLLDVAVGTSAVGDVARKLALPGFLILTGSLVGSLQVGLAPWIVEDLARDAAVAASFLAAVHVARRDGPRSSVVAGRAVVLGLAAVVAQLVIAPGAELRAQGTFPNPNVAGHFVATCLVGSWAFRLGPVTRLAVLAAGGAGLLLTSSFGALVQVSAGVGYLALARAGRALARRPRALLGAGAAVLAVGALGLTAALDTLPADTSESALSAERLERSATTRLELWEQGVEILSRNPLGIGPATTRGMSMLDGELELHNQPLAYLVERGVLGLAGLAALAAALWRLAPRTSVSRALLVGFGVQMLLRETMHYRHLWLVLAATLVTELRRPETAR